MFGALAILFFLGLLAFFIEATALATQRRASGFPVFRRFLARQQHGDQSLADISQIAALVTVLLTANDDFSLSIDSVSETGQESTTPIRAHRNTISWGPVERNLGVHFIDILTTGTTAARGGNCHFSAGNGETRIDIEIGHDSV